MGLIARVADRLLHTTALSPPFEVRPEVVALHRSIPVVDLVVGTVLFRRTFLPRRTRGHVDLPRLQDGGVAVVGLTIATRHPDLRGTFSTPHFRSLGLPVRQLRSNMSIAEAFVHRIEHWTERSGGRLRLVRTAADLDLLLEARRNAIESEQRPPVGVFLGVQGGHVLDADPANAARLHALGVRMLALAHVMDNELVGSNTGVRRGGLTGLARETIAELERVGVLVDLAHMSSAGIRDAVPLMRRPFALSHTGFRELAGSRSRWRRFSPANRNVATDDARLVAEAGGLIGVVLATQLLGGERLEHAVRSFEFAVRLAGGDQVAIGSDLDGALRATFDVSGMPLLTQGLVDAGMGSETARGVMGDNALRLLRTVLH